MDTNKWILYWAKVGRIEDSSALELRGYALNGAGGFSPPDRLSFQGVIQVVGRWGRLEIPDAQLSQRHSTRSGFSLILRAARQPKPDQIPFLVTNNLQVEVIYSGEVEIRAEEEMGMIIRDQDIEMEYFVGCEDWFGVVVVPPPQLRTSYKLFGFSDRPGVKVGDQLLHLLDREAEFGSVHPKA